MLAFVGVLGGVFGAVDARAGEFSITPLKVDLLAGQRTQLLTLTNNGRASARFLVRSAGWSTVESGGVELTPDSDLLVFPASFTVPPQGSQAIRVGTRVASGAQERTWRVVLEELPGDASESGGATVQVLSVLSVPVFLPATTVRRSLSLALSSVAGRQALVTVDNTGNTHAMLAQVSLVALRGAAEVSRRAQEGWYVLPGSRRSYRFTADADWCASADRFEVRVADREDQPVATQSIDAREVCR